MLQLRFFPLQKGFIRNSFAFYCFFTICKGGSLQISNRPANFRGPIVIFWPSKAAQSTILRSSRAIRWLSIFLLFDFQVQRDVLAAVKTRNRTCRRFRALFFRMDFVVGIWVKPAEAVLPCGIRV